MTVRTYRSTQLGATALTGQTGVLVSVLDAVLVTGYGPVTATSITRSGATATATVTAHGLATGDVANIAGANETDYNGNFIVTVTGVNAYTYTVANAPATPATGLIMSKRAGAGWTKDFTATSKATFRNSPSTGTGFYLDVNDAGPGAGTFKEARVSGFETMSAVATGTGQFPTTAQQATNLFLRKSNTADATARPWVIVADETCFYLFVETGDFSSPTKTHAFMFGDIFSYKTSDVYRCMIAANATENAAGAIDSGLMVKNGVGFGLATATSGHYLARGTSGTGSSIACGKHDDAGKNADGGGNNTLIGGSVVNTFVYPNPADNGLYMSPLFIHHTGCVRGYLKGLWSPLQYLPLGHGDTFSGTGALAGKTFLSQVTRGVTVGNSYPTGEMFVETSNTWS